MPGLAADVECVRLRLTGAVDMSALHLLTRAAQGGPFVLDVSGVTQADQAAITLLARISPAKCEIVGCPSWLALAIEGRRRDLRVEGW
jgi:hypothetical protein